MAKAGWMDERPWARRAYIFACALVAAMAVSWLNYWPDSAVEAVRQIGFASLGIVIVLVLIEIFTALSRRAGPQDGVTKE